MSLLGTNENVIEWLTNQKEAGLTLNQPKYINRIRSIAKNHPEVRIIAENEDGSLYCKVPLSYIKISPPREMTDEQRKAASERLKKNRVNRGAT